MITFKRRFLAAVMAVLTVMSCFAGMTFSAGAESSGDFEYEVLDDETVRITGYSGSDTDVVIPAEIGGKKVTSIGEYAFGYGDMQTVSIPESVTSIGNGAFYNCSLKTVSLPASITDIGDSAFELCQSLTDIAIPDGVNEIGASAFASCESLTNISIPASVINIVGNVFVGCIALASITVDENNVSYKSEDGVLFNKDMTQIITYPNKHGSEYAIPDGVKTIGAGAFSGCDNLDEISMPDSVTDIGSDAFSGCVGLTDISLSDSVESIGEYAFAGCSGLTEIIMPDSITDIGANAFAACDSLATVMLSDSITEIGDYVFEGCELLDDISIPDGVTRIGEYAFASCTSLESISLPYELTDIGACAFASCSALEEVIIPENVESIGREAFANCDMLDSVDVPVSVTEIGAHAFGFMYESDPSSILRYKCVLKEDFTLICSEGSAAEDYAKENNINAEQKKPEFSYSVNDDSTVTITKYKGKSLNVVIPDKIDGMTVTGIDRKAFVGADDIEGRWGLETVTIPDSVKNISDIAFYLCFDMEEIIVSDDNENYKSVDGVLYNKDMTELIYCPNKCSENIVIPDSVKRIGNNAFHGCDLMTDFDIPENIESIGDSAFVACNFDSITIPKTVTSIGRFAFGYEFDDIYDKVIEKYGFVIRGYAGSAAEQYAKNFEFIFDYIKTDCKHEKTELRNVVEATCQHQGYTGDLVCLECGEIIEHGSKVIATGHKYVNGVCSVCGDIYMDSKSELTSKSEQIKVNNETKQAVYTPASNSGMKVSEFKKQFDGEISIDMDDNALIANGTKFKFGDSEFTVIVKGDVQADGKITASDARTILRISAKLDKADDAGMSAADVNGDGKVTAGEARQVLRFSAKLESSISN